MAFDGITIANIAQELNQTIVGGKINKIAQPENDELARTVLREAFPAYEVVGIDCRALIKQHGSLHCVTMQYPMGVIK